jgi:cathepsin F
MWDAFKQEYDKTYPTLGEEILRFAYFLESLQLADYRNNIEASMSEDLSQCSVHGITQFSDWTQTVFERTLLSSGLHPWQPPEPEPELASSSYVNANDSSLVAPLDLDDLDLPVVDLSAALVDWVGVYTTKVKDQGYCGSCWAFTAAEQIESDAIRTLKGFDTKSTLSPQQVTSCDTKSWGCDGGWPEVGA